MTSRILLAAALAMTFLFSLPIAISNRDERVLDPYLVKWIQSPERGCSEIIYEYGPHHFAWRIGIQKGQDKEVEDHLIYMKMLQRRAAQVCRGP